MIGLRAHHQQQRQQHADRTRSDISRLLDPSYATSYYRQQSTHTGLYVDAQGDLHDPDYRPFPIITSINGRRWADDSALTSEDEDDLPEDYHTTYYSSARYSPTKPKQTTTNTYYRRSSSPSSGAILTGIAGASPISSFASTSSSASSSASSSSSPSMLSRAHSPFDHEESQPKEKLAVCRIASSLKRKRRRSSSTSLPEIEWDEPRSRFVQEEVLEEDDEEEVEDEKDEFEEKKKRVLSRSENLKKQWRVMSLSIQFGLFRARKRVKSLI